MKLVSFLSKENYTPLITLTLLFSLVRILVLAGYDDFQQHTITDELITLLLLVVSSIIVFFSVIEETDRYKKSFVIYFFLLMISCLLHHTIERNIIISNLFVLIGLKLILNFNSKGNHKLKIFDSTFCFGLSALFFPKSIWFLLVIIMNILFFHPKKIKYWIIPIFTLATLYILRFNYNILIHNSFELQSIDFPLPVFNNINLDYFRNTLPFIIIIIIGIIINIYLVTNKTRFQNYKEKIWLILVSMIVSVFIALFESQKQSGAFLFIMFPLSVIFTNFINVLKTPFYKEIIVWIITLAVMIIGVAFSNLL